VTFDADQQKCRIDDRQLSDTVCSWVPVTLRKCVNVEDTPVHFTQSIDVSKVKVIPLQARCGLEGG
jgi:hypothetical protein